MLDWDDLRFFLALTRHGTLAAAAKELRVTQSTVSRRLASLQEQIGARLLQRTADGYVLTLAGESIRAHVEHVEEQMLSVERTVGGRDTRLEGLVRVASTQLLTSHLLVPSFAALHNLHDGIQIESLPEGGGELLAVNAADIVVQLRRFEHPDLIMRNIGTVGFGLYACLAYLVRHGEPDFGRGCAGQHLITMMDHPGLSEQAAWLAEHAGHATVVLKADSYETQYWSASTGGGLALLPRFRADAEPALRRLNTSAPVPSAEVWLGVHRENRAVPRVRTVLDVIAVAVQSRAATLDPP